MSTTKTTVKSAGKSVIEVEEFTIREADFNLLGTTPLIMNRYSQKAWHELLFPRKKQNRAGLEQTLKHEPFEEYRGALYRNRDEKEPTLVHVPSGAFHKALAAAALDVPGEAKKAQIERLTSIATVQVNLYGTPRIFCAMVRNSDAKRTPDVRTRPIFEKWCCSIKFVFPDRLTDRGITNLMAWAGNFVGIGDWRPQKGGSYGRFTLVQDRDPRFLAIKKEARAAQERAFKNPDYHDADTEELLAWFQDEVKVRQMQNASRETSKRTPVKGAKAKPSKTPKRKNGSDFPVVAVSGNPEADDERVVG